MHLDDEYIKEYQAIYKKEYGKDLSWEEASDQARRLLGLFEILFEQTKIDHVRQLKLKDSPKGFHIEGIGYSCAICGNSVSNDETWYDQDGISCLFCRDAKWKKIIPRSAYKDKESWYASWELENHFKVKWPTIRKFIRLGKLKPRIVPGKDGGAHFQFFMIKDNEGFLPPKPKIYSVPVEGQERTFTIKYEEVESPFK